MTLEATNMAEDRQAIGKKELDALVAKTIQDLRDATGPETAKALLESHAAVRAELARVRAVAMELLYDSAVAIGMHRERYDEWKAKIMGEAP